LVAFADENNGLMAQLKEKYNFSGKEWRVALANWQFISPQKERIDSEIDGHSNTATYSVEKQLFSPDEAADFLSVHVQTIRGYIRMGKLPALRLAGERALRIKREDLLGLLEPFKPDET
jgi:excisionase family DNA binding protein